MGDPGLSAFLSSKMGELDNERTLLWHILNKVAEIKTFPVELDAGAGSNSLQMPCLNEVEASDIYVGLFWNEFSGAVVEEFECARSSGKPCFIYIRGNGLGRDERLGAFLTPICKDSLSPETMEMGDMLQLGWLVWSDVQNWLTRTGRSRVNRYNPRQYRLINDLVEMLEFVKKKNDIEILKIENWLETYYLRFRMKGILRVDSSDQPVFGEDHLVQMQLPYYYPNDHPLIRFTTPMFHPNVSDLGDVDVGWWQLSSTLPELCVGVGKIIDYQVYSSIDKPPYPTNRVAAMWAKRHGDKLPLTDWSFRTT